MKKKRFDENNDLIKLTDRRKNSNKKNMNISNEKINLKDKTTEETKTSVNQTHRDEFNNNNIITILRVRPENPYEKRYSNINIIKIESSTSMQLISPIEYNYYIEGTKFINGDRGIEISKTEKYNYEFDHIFDYTAQQSKVYEYSAEFLVRNIFEGFNSTIFAYGAIGSGKSYTMFGTNDKPGIIIRSINQIFTLMKEQKINVDYCLQMSYYKIYNETIIDLLSEENIQNFNQEENINKINLKSNIRKNKKSFFMDITKKIISSPEEAYQILSSSQNTKYIKEKDNLSKAHYIVEINIIINPNKTSDNNPSNKYGKFILVDLAGFEKVVKIKPNTENFYVNKSLFTLTTCINGLINNHNTIHIPWRDSKLTMILKDYLSGNSKIVMIANISPSFLVIEDTFNTLNFAKKIKKVKTHAQKNTENDEIRIDKYDSIIESLKAQISNVKKEIDKNEKLNNSMISSYEKSNESIEENNELNGNELLGKYVDEIKNHFNNEIELNKQINDVEFNIIKINKENYFNRVNNKVDKNNIKEEANKLNDYQLKINSLYSKRYKLVQKRKDIQIMISKETKKDNNLGKYLMYVYKYYINLINQIQSKNRQNKIDADRVRKGDQIMNLSQQIKIRDNYLQDISEKIGKHNISFNKRRLIRFEELDLDPCLQISVIKKENNLNSFANKVIMSSDKKMSRNWSMPSLSGGQPSLRKKGKIKIIQHNSLLPYLKRQKNINFLRKTKNDSSIFKKKIPLGFILRNERKGNDVKKNFFGQFQKYYNIYHVSNNYHVGNFHHANPNYMKNKNLGNKNNYSRIISNNFENYVEKKVKTILNKNYISRYNNSPYSLENI